MKLHCLTITFAVLLLQANSQGYGDTLYVNQSTGDRAQQIVFIDSPHSRFHKMVFDNLLSDSSLFSKSIDPLSQSASNRKGGLYADYIGDWITVQKYKGKLFAYYPSEPYYNTFIRITDSTIVVNDFNEGFITLNIFKRKRKTSKYTFELSGYSDVKHTLSIKQINRSLFEVTSSLFNTRKLNIVKTHSYFDLPIIVNYCPENRCEEFNFQ